MWTYQEAKPYAEKIGGKIVGSVKTKGKSEHDLDILVDRYSQGINDILESMNFVYVGSQVVSPDEIRKSRKFGKNSNQWLRNRQYENIQTKKIIEIWTYEGINEMIKISTLKDIIKAIIKEVSQKDIKSRHPHPCMPFVGNGQTQPDFSRMTLDNLKAIRDKCKRSIDYVKNHPELRTRREDLQRELNLLKLCNDELNRRLQYINKPVSENNKGLGYNHNSSSDLRSIPSVRDELNDPIMNGKLHEGQYKFDDFNWMKRGDGFGIPSDVYYGTILLGVIVSQENGYLVATIKGPTGDRSYRQDPKKPFKTKDDAAEALHRAWKSLRHGEETKSF